MKTFHQANHYGPHNEQEQQPAHWPYLVRIIEAKHDVQYCSHHLYAPGWAGLGRRASLSCLKGLYVRGGSPDSIAAVSIRWIKRAMTSSNCRARFRAHCGTVSLLAKNIAAPAKPNAKA